VLGAFLCLAVPLKVDFKKHLHKNIALLPYFSSVPKKKYALRAANLQINAD